MRLSSGAGLALLALLAAASCQKELRPGHCFTDKDCNAGQTCDSVGRCIPPGTPTDGGGPADGRDGRPPDGPACKRTEDCSGGTPVCDTSIGQCVQCLNAGMCPSASAPVCGADRRCGGCSMDAHCSGRADGLKVCDTASGACVACTKNTDCSGATPVCDTTARRCVQCMSASQCPAMAPACTASRMCGRCSADTDCSGRSDGLKACDMATGACVACTKNIDCGGATPLCDTGARRCVQCLDSSACSGSTPICGADRRCTRCSDSGQCAMRGDAARRFCLASTGACVQCLDSDGCSGTTPYCAANACTSCGGDDGKCVGMKAEPGICMEDGHCAAQSEVIYVKYAPTCDSSPEAGDGSLGAPYCTVNAGARSKLSASRRTIVLRGSLDRWALDAPSSFRTLVIGQQGAEVIGGTGTIVSVTSGDVSFRGFTVTGGGTSDGLRVSGSSTKLNATSLTVRRNGGVGVLASGGATLRMNRCMVVSNAGGGIKTDGAAFDITNTIIVDNSSGALVGGVNLGAAPASGPTRFLNNTVADNKKGGTSCASGSNYSLLGSILYNNDGLDVTGACVMTPCCSGNPLLTPTYRLMSGSPCIDQLAPAMSVPDDIDGKMRPHNGRSDCGASEWSP